MRERERGVYVNLLVHYQQLQNSLLRKLFRLKRNEEKGGLESSLLRSLINFILQKNVAGVIKL